MCLGLEGACLKLNNFSNLTDVMLVILLLSTRSRSQLKQVTVFIQNGGGKLPSQGAFKNEFI